MLSNLIKNERSAFVSGEAAGKTDGQCVGIEQLVERDEIGCGKRASCSEPAPGKLDHFAAQSVSQRP